MTVSCAWVGLGFGGGPGVRFKERFIGFARDGSGTVWAQPNGSDPKLATLDGDEWVRHEVEGLPERSGGVSLVTLADGEVAAFWRDGAQLEPAWTVTLHRAGKSRVWARFRARIGWPVVFARRDGGAVITGQGATVVLLAREQEEAQVLSLQSDLIRQPEKPDHTTKNVSLVSVRVVDDAAGRLYFWSEAWAPTPSLVRLAGIVRYDLEKRVQERWRPDDVAMPIAQVVAWDAAQLGIAVPGRGLVLAPLDLSQPVQVATPDTAPFRHIERVFHDGSAWHAVTSPAPPEVVHFENKMEASWYWETRTQFDPANPNCALWKYDGAAWQKLGERLGFQMFEHRPWLRTAHGLFLGDSSGGPPWFFPVAPDGKPRRITDARLFPLPIVWDMVPADAARVLMLHRHETACVWPADAPEPAPHPRWYAVQTRGPALQDARGRFWGVRLDGQLLKWENRKWNLVKVPPEVAPILEGLTADDRNRGWVRSVDGKPTAICDFADETWKVFPSLEAALQAQLPDGVRLHIPYWPKFEPVFSGDGRIAVFVPPGTLHHYEANAWRRWDLNDIFTGNEELIGGPFFATDGLLSVPVREVAARQWHGAGGWQRRENVRGPQRPDPFEGRKFVDGRYRYARGAVDRFEVRWWLRDGVELCKSVHGRTVPVFAADEADPLQYSEGVYVAHVDDEGHAFLDSTHLGNDHDQTFLKPRTPPPRTTARLVEVVRGAARIALAAEPAEGAWFTWRLDDGEWRVVESGAELRTEPLPVGEHRIDIRAWNAELTPDAHGASVPVRIQGVGPE